MKAMIKRGVALATVVAGFGIVGAGCLTRPVASSNPQTSTTFTGSVTNQVIDKLDILFDIDNSASMGDKQQYLVQAIPDLIGRLLNPDCVDPTTNDPLTDANGNPIASTNGVCTQGQLEFNPVHNMHLGIVTSSLGSRLSDQPKAEQNSQVVICDPKAMVDMPFGNLSTHNDDQGHLVARSLTYTPTTGTPTGATEGSVPGATPTAAAYAANPPSYSAAGFIDWYPAAANTGGGANPLPAGLNPEPMQSSLTQDFTSMVQGVGIYGCGIESQLESWYRFLVQPDPYASLVLDSNGAAQWNSVDTTILQQRADFLRPDSLVAVIVLTDENDSEIDVRSYGGQGYLFMGEGFDPPHGTSECATDPSNNGCTNCQSGSTDPACTPATYTAQNDWGFDPNLRHVHMKAKYGLDPQYPWQRYVIGLTQTMIPDRNGEYPPGATNYYGMNDCTNPLYAASLPSGSTLTGTLGQAQLCNLPLGTRTQDLIFYAIIGGVPNQLLPDPTDPNAGLVQADWVRILGNGPASVGLSDPPSYDYSGIDPHMIESYQDRSTATNVDTSRTNPLSAPSTAPEMPDPVNGREWTTNMPYNPAQAAGSVTAFSPHVLAVDREYACIFPLPTPRDCTQQANSYQCDCPANATPMALTADELPPVCNPNNPTQQVAAKVYPTIRELQVARLMGDQGIVSSLCPIDVTDNAAGNDPKYGYRPAVNQIINRLKKELTNQCLPEKLAASTGDAGAGVVPCLILVQLPASEAGASCLNPTCDESQGLSVPETDVLTKFCAAQELAYTQGGSVPPDPATQSVCVLNQLNPVTQMGDFDTTGSCANSGMPGWCYVEGAAAKGCGQAIVFANGSPPPGAKASLQCIEQSANVLSNDGG